MGIERALEPTHWFYRFARTVLTFVFSLAWRASARGLCNLPLRGPAIVVGNHPSYLDPVGIWAMSEARISFMTWDAVFRVPAIRTLVAWSGAFPVDTEAMDFSAVRTAAAVLRSGGIMGIFPEGERSFPGGEMRPFKKAAFRMAVKFGAPVFPVRTEGSGRIWPRGRVLPRLGGRIRFTCFPPVMPSDFASCPDPAQALMDRVRAVLEGGGA